MFHVMDLTKPKEIWDKLATQYMSRTLTTKLYLKQKLYGLKIHEGSDLMEHLNVFNQLVADLARREVTVDDEDKAIILLCSLPPSYEHVVTTLTYGKETIKIEDITAALLAWEQRRKNNAVEAPQAEGLLVNGEPRRGKVEAKSKRKKKVQCFKCGDWGHVKECPGKKASANVAASVGDSNNDSNLL
jgi:hypothetical protein